MGDKIIEQLKELRNIKPDKNWVAVERELLMSQISSQRQINAKQSVLINSWFLIKSILPSGVMKFIAQPVGISVVLLIIVSSTGMLGVNASRGSLPGDFLYSVKLTSEHVKMGLVVNKTKEAELHVKFAEERVKEIEAISASKSNDKKQQIKIAAEGLKKEMANAQTKLDAVKLDKGKSQEVVAASKKVDQKIEEMSNRLDNKKEDLKVEDKEIKNIINEAEKAVDATGVKAVQIIVEKHESGEVKMSESELVSTIEKKIDQLEKKDNSEKAADTLTEAKDLLHQGALSSAMEKVKESSDLAN